MKQAIKYTLTALLLICSTIAHAQLTVHAELLAVGWNGSFGDGNGAPEITWSVRGGITDGWGGNYSNDPSSPFHIVEKNNPASNVDISSYRVLASQTITNPATLCYDYPRVGFRLEAWEDDCNPRDEFNGCFIFAFDDHREFNWTSKTLLDLTGVGINHAVVDYLTTDSYWMKYRYWIEIGNINPTLNAVIAGTNNLADMNNLCQDIQITYKHPYTGSTRGGYIEWERENSSGVWEDFNEGENLSQITVFPDPNYSRYRTKSTFIQGQCLGQDDTPNDDTDHWSTSLENVVAPSINNLAVNLTTTKSCYDATNEVSFMDGAIDVNIPSIPGNGSVDVALLQNTWNGTVFEETYIAGVTGLSASPSNHTFDNLINGNYIIRVTSKNALGNGQCSKDFGASILNSYVYEISLIKAEDVSCAGENDGTIKVASSNFFEYGITPSSTGVETRSAPTGGSIKLYENLTPDTYTIKSYNSLNCSLNSVVATIDEPAPLNLTATADPEEIECFGGQSTITFQYSGGTGTNRYLYENNKFIHTLQSNSYTINRDVGTYEYRLVDANGCEATQTITIDQPANPVTLNLSTVNTTSCMEDIGEIVATGSGGTPPYEYKIGLGGSYDTENTFTDLSQGEYEIFCKDVNDCETSTSVTIEGAAAITYAINYSTFPQCFGDDTGLISFTANNGNGLYTISVYNSQGSLYSSQNNVPQGVIMVNGLLGDTYTIEVEDEDDCQISFIFEIFEPLEQNILGYELSYDCDAVCFNVEIESYSLDNTQQNPPFEQQVEFTLSNNVVSGFEYATRQTPLGASPAIYQVCYYEEFDPIDTIYNIRFNNSCINNPDIVIDPPVISSDTQGNEYDVNITHETCAGRNDGTVEIFLTGVNSPVERILYLIDYNSYDTIQTAILPFPEDYFLFEGVPPSRYYVSQKFVIDGAIPQCRGLRLENGEDGYDVFSGSLNVYHIVTGPDLICAQDNGEIELIAQGGTPPYEFSIDQVNWSSNNAFTNISNGTPYYVRDATECVVESSVAEYPVGNSPLTADIYNLQKLSDCGPAIDSIVINSVDGPFDISVLQFQVGVQESSNNFGVSWVSEDNYIIITNPYDNSVGDPAGTAGEFLVQVIDTALCDIQFWVNFQIPDTMELNLTNSIDISCAGEENGTISVLADIGTAPYTYTLDNDPTTSVTLGEDVEAVFNNLAQGVHIIHVQDSEGCQDFILDTITIAQDIVVNTTFGNPLLCANDSTGMVDFDIIGGVAPYNVQLTQNGLADGNPFQLNEGEIYTLNDVPSTELQLVITDANGCDHYRTIYHPGPNSIDIFDIVEKSPICYNLDDGEISFTMNGGTGILKSRLNGGALSTDTSYTGLGGGSYFLEIIDDNNCMFDTTIILDTPEPIIMNVTSTDVQCNGDDDGTITITASGGSGVLTYSIDGNNFVANNTFTNLGPNSYTVYAKDALGCLRDSVNVLVDEAPLLVLTEDIVQDADCNGLGIISVMVAGGAPGYTYDWDNGASTNDTLYNAAAGPHTVEITDMNGCKKNLTITLTVFNTPVIIVDQIIDEACGQEDGSMQLSGDSGTAPYSFTLGATTNNTGTFGPLPAGIYSISITDNEGCINTKDVTIGSVSAPSLSVSNQTPTSCTTDDGTITLDATGGTSPFTYAWSHDNNLTGPNATGLAAGIYDATVTDNRGCTDEISVTITQIASPVANVAQTNPSLCGMDNGTALIGVVGGQPPYNYTWSHDANLNSQSASNLSAGNYAVTISDQNQCEDIVNFEIIEIEGPSLTIATLQDETCDQGNGEIILTSASGTAPFIYKWSHNPAVLGNTASNLSAGTYNVTIEDANGCMDEILAIEISNIPGVALALTNQTDNTCADGNAVINLEATGGTPNYTYTWSHDVNLNAPTASDLTAGTYNVTVEDMTTCTDELSITIAEGTLFAIDNQEVTQPSCTVDNGSIVLSILGGVSPYTYNWSHDNNLNAPNATGLGIGTYDVSITDQTGCEIIRSYLLTVPPNPSAGFPLATNSSCGLDNGSISINVSGGLAPYTYTWSHDPQLTGSIAEDLAPGNYSMTLTDVNGCIDIASVVITGTAAATTDVANTTDETCGLDNGEINLFATSGASPFTYAWSHDPALTGPTATGLAAGTYTITMTDFNGCMDTTTIEIEEIGQPSITTTFNQNNSCDPANGAITLTTVDGTAPFSYSWAHDPLLTGPSISGLDGGTYMATVTDANGCTDETIVNILNSPILSSSISNVIQSDCGGANGSIEVTTQGGVAPYNFIWSHDANLNSNIASGIGGGSYTVTITDQLGCTTMLTETITETSPPVINNVVTEDAACTDESGSITVNVILGTPPYSYAWSHDPTEIGMTVTNVGGGIYTVTVTDVNGCEDIRNITIATTDGPSNFVSSQINPSCGMANGTIVLNVSGGATPYTYEWYLLPDNNTVISSNMILTDAIAGDYFVRVTDANGCKTERITTLYEDPIMTLIGSSTETTCHNTEDGSASITVTLGGVAPFTYLWNDPAAQTTATATNLSAGNYAVTVSDAIGCIRTRTVNVSSPDPLSYELENLVAPSCMGDADGAADIIISGGSAPYTVSWTNGSDSGTGNNLNNIPAGTYTISIEDANGCTQVFEFDIEEPSALILSEGVNTSSNCSGNAGGTLGVVVNGGTAPFTYLWNDPLGQTTATAYNLDEGNYTVDVTDANGCTSSFNAELAPGGDLEIVFNLITSPSCQGNADGAIDISVVSGSGDYTFQWNDPNFQTTEDLQNVSAGPYQIFVSDNITGCTATETYFLAPGQEFLVQTLQSTNVLCSLDSLGSANVLILTGGTAPYTYLWDDPLGQTSDTATNLVAGIYTVTVTDANGCTDAASIPVLQLGVMEVEEISNIGASCIGANDGSAEIAVTGASGPITVEWPELGVTGNTINNLESGNYTANISNTFGCEINYTIMIEGPDELILSPGDIIPPQCDASIGGSLTVEASGGTGGYTYLWNDPLGQFGATALDLEPGDYTVTVTDENGCEDQIEMTVPQTSSLLISLVESISPECNGDGNGSIEVSVTGGDDNYQYIWNDVAAQTTATATNLPAGEYIVQITNGDGTCATNDTFLLEEPELLMIGGIEAINPECAGEENGQLNVEVNGGTGPYMILIDGLGSFIGTSVTDLPPGDYNFSVMDANSCISDMETFSLIDPEGITITEIIIQPVCAEDANGSIAVTPTGGTGGYTYLWIESGDDSATQNNLTSGTYTLEVRDENGCSASKVYELESTSPEISIITSEEKLPSCADANNGAIELDITGGFGNLSIEWSTGANNVSSISDLTAAIYSVTVSDENGCSESQTYDISNVGDFEINLLDDSASYCDGITLLLGEEAQAERSYSWTGPNGFTSTDSEIAVFESGDFTLTVEEAGCIASETISVVEFEDALEPLFIIPTQVVVNDTVVALEVTWPIPDEVEWIYDENLIDFAGVEGNQIRFVFPVIGDYTIGLRAKKGQCEGEIYKDVSVFADSSQIVTPIDFGDRQIISASLTPNPNQGIFNVNLELNTQADYTLSIFDINGIEEDSRVGNGISTINEAYNISLNAGIYVMVIQSKTETRSITFVVE